MSKKSVALLLCGMIALLPVLGCDEDKTVTPAGGTTQLDMIDLAALIEQVAPPEFTGPVGSPLAVDSVWFHGDYPLLEKVFGSRDPQTLYANINDFKMSMAIITNTMRVNGQGAIVTGIYVDSHLVDMEDGETMIHFTATVSALDEPTVVPADAQEVIGTAVDVDYLIRVEPEEMPGALIYIGLTLNDSEQTLWQFDSASGDPEDTESRSIYASLDPTDSSFVFRGLGYCLHAGGELFTYAFNIESAASSDFAYRMSFFSNGTPGMTFLNCIIGGGNKDEEFALKYRVFSPADTNVVDSVHMYDQLFGPNYSDGAGELSTYIQYLDEDLMFGYDIVPQAMLHNPWAED
jgi:hypothetical protein